MKRIISIILISVFTICVCLSVSAETTILSSGSYTIGKNLPAGEYIITCTEASDFYNSYLDLMKSLTDDDDSMQSLWNMYGELADAPKVTVKITGSYGENKGKFELEQGASNTVTLKDNWTISLEDGSCSFDLTKSAVLDEENTNTTIKATASNVHIELNSDLSQYTDEEILALYNLVSQEIVSRRIDKSAKIPGGSFIVGSDIPAGKYTVERIGSSWTGPTLKVYANASKNLELIDEYLSDGESYILDLEDGNLFETSSDVLLTVFTGITFQ